MKTINISLFLLLSFVFSSLVPIEISASEYEGDAVKDSLKFKVYQGKIIDEQTEAPVVFATIIIEGTNIGTVSNSEGAFLIKVPENSTGSNLVFTHIGYKIQKMPLKELEKGKDIIVLVSKATDINQVTVRTQNPIDLLDMAYKKIKDNYRNTPEMQRAFYRETVKKGRNYVGILESVVDIYKGSYDRAVDNDRSVIYKARKSRDVKNMDTVLFKLQGGPAIALLLDVAKNPQNLITPDVREYYNYTLNGIVTINNRMAYVIHFNQKPQYEYPLYEGDIYIDYESLAISGIRFNISEEKLNEASTLLVRKKPISMNVKTQGAYYMANYRMVDNLWYLHYVRAETNFKCKWKRKLFAANYNTTIEMAITNRTDESVTKFKNNIAFKQSQAMTDNINDFQDDDFWGSDNTIRPDESIENAIKRLNRKLN